MILDLTTRSLVAKMGAAITTVAPDYVISYRKRGNRNIGGLQAGEFSDSMTNCGALNGMTRVILVSAPDGRGVHEVEFISFSNLDSVSVKFIVELNDNGTYRRVFSCDVGAGRSLLFAPSFGSQVIMESA